MFIFEKIKCDQIISLFLMKVGQKSVGAISTSLIHEINRNKEKIIMK